MATKSKNNKSIIIGVCIAVVIVVLIILGIVFATRNGGVVGLNDAFFTSDNTKYVLNLDADDMTFEDEMYTPAKTHLVYFYDGDKITGLKAYYEYADENGAKSAYDYLTSEQQDSYKSITRDGKYVILEANEEEYEGVTTDDVKQQIEFMETLKNINVEDTSGETVTEESTDVETNSGEVVETTEAETVQE